MNQSGNIGLDESSARYDGWRIVVVCFLVATFGWGLGFYGQSVYLAELNRLHGWSTSLISSATTFFYLFGAVLVAFVSEAVRSFGPRNCLLGGVFAMGAAGVMIGQVTSPWQLYLANAVLAFGWAGTSLGNHHQHAWSVVRQQARHGNQSRAERRQLWRHRRSAAAGGWYRVFRIRRRHDRGSSIEMLVLMIPIILIFVGRPPPRFRAPLWDQVLRSHCPQQRASAPMALRNVAISYRGNCVRPGSVRAGWNSSFI